MKAIGLTSNDLIAHLPVLSDDEWAQRDREVQAERDRERGADVAKNRAGRREALVERGWPSRALDVAERAAERAPVAFLRTWDPKASGTSVVVLSGSTGTGKTVAAAVWALERARVVPTFMRAAAFAASSRFDADARASWCDAGALVLDDLGAEYADAKGNFQSALDELVDTYYADWRPLVVTTNLTLDQFRGRYGARIEDRLRECATWRSIPGESMRKRATP